MEPQDQELSAAFGEATIYSYFVEDRLKLHLVECAYFQLNGYNPDNTPPGLSRFKSRKRRSMAAQQIREIRSFKKLIDEFSKVYPKKANLAAKLHLLREIRNLLVHHSTPQLGKDFGTEFGIDQIHAMFLRIAKQARLLSRQIEAIHEQILSTVHSNPEWSSERLRREGDPEPAGTVAASEIQGYLTKLEQAPP